LNREGFPGKFPDQDLVNFMGKKVSEFLYKTKTSHIIDADMIRFYDKALANATGNGAKLLVIHLVCPEEIILKRLEERQSKINEGGSQNYSEVGFSLSVKEEYLERTAMHNGLPLPKDIYFRINTSENFDSQLNHLIIRLREDRYL
ncbi:MAG: hypothetical protein U0944_02655, partial [Candidatus Moranbacteria bacterium]|nr:hypothetical protein [Candidatus Moranbacteria bacterium]